MRGRFANDVKNVDAVATAWGGNVEPWLHALAAACDERSQAQVAKLIGYSSSVVSQVLANKYAGDMRKVADSVGAHIMMERVSCPEAGDLSRRRCLELQERSSPPYASGFHRRIWRHCQTCPNFRGPRK